MEARDEHGMALVVALTAVVVLSALGSALVLVSMSETMIAANFRAANEAFYGADAILERTLADLRAAPSWDPFLSGAARSSFVDGPPTGSRRLADGSTIDLGQVVNMANCQKLAACTDAEMNAKSSERPWGVTNPRWKAYAYGQLADSAGSGALSSRYFVVALVADDPAETDDDPAHDGSGSADPPNPGAGILLVRAEAFGPRGGHRTIEATVARIEPSSSDEDADPQEIRVLSWSEVR